MGSTEVTALVLVALGIALLVVAWQERAVRRHQPRRAVRQLPRDIRRLQNRLIAHTDQAFFRHLAGTTYAGHGPIPYSRGSFDVMRATRDLRAGQLLKADDVEPLEGNVYPLTRPPYYTRDYRESLRDLEGR